MIAAQKSSKKLSFPKRKMKVLLLENINKTAENMFLKQGYSIETVTKALGEEELAQKLQDTYILGIRSQTHITKKVLESAKKLLAVGTFCIGTNQVDLAAARIKGIPVFNAPYSNTRSVVELVLGEIIMLYRGVMDKSNNMHSGIWEKSAKGSYEIRGKKLGIIGYGNIGSQLSVLAENLGMEVYFYDIAEKLSLGNVKKCTNVKTLLRTADVVTVHVDGRVSNKNLIGEKEFALMKDGAFFINASRGFVVDTASLTKYIKNGKISGAAIDVFPVEPKSNAEKFVSNLQQLPNVILTPHIAGSTKEAQENIGSFVAERLTQYIDKGDTLLSVNFPNVQLPGLANAHRLLHIHENKPGVLSNINNVFAQHKINIVGQYLKAEENIGYVITDINKKYDTILLEELKKINGTIKLRVLY